MKRKYIGTRREGCALVSVIEAGNIRRALRPGFEFVKHSPSGFEWGYGGSGPAQLAFALLLDHCQAPGPALMFHQDFKWNVISKFGDDWELTTDEIEFALNRIRIFRTRANQEAEWKSST